MWNRLKDAKKPILLYGMGNGADKILAELARRDIPVSGVFASDGFARHNDYHGFTVISYSEAKAKWGQMIVLLAFGSQRSDVLELIAMVEREQELYVPYVPVIGGEIFDEAYALRHQAELERVRAALADDGSRRVFDGIVEFRLTGKTAPLRGCESGVDEAYEAVLRLGAGEDYVDLGAYRGDTVAEFLRYAPDYSSILAVEPDKKTFLKLQQATAHLARCRCVNVGISEKREMLPFAAKGGRCSAVGEGGSLLQMESVDSLLCGRRAGYIKMDIEGQELAAIAGARETIAKYRPKMLISAYHRTEDIFAVPLGVLSVRPDYRVYLRHFPYLPDWDTNYYFV